MSIIIVLLTVVLVLNCLFLGLLILVQLPKKEAGVGMAFGGGAADALFGAGSGTALSNLTKYSATLFFVLVFMLSVMITHSQHSDVSALNRAMMKQPAPAPPSPAVSAPTVTPGQPASTNMAIPTVPMSVISNSTAAPATTTTNPPVVPAK